MDKTKRHLKNEYQNFFMEETSPLNPYGPNYHFLAYDTKVYNKFNRLKRYVHLTPEDTERLLKGNVYYFCGIVTSLLYYGLMGSCTTTLGYSFLTDYYIMKICSPMIPKYLEKAVENGFEDYQLDETHKNNKLIIYIKKLLNFPL